MKVVFPAPLGPMIAATFLGANSPVTPGFWQHFLLSKFASSSDPFLKTESQRKSSPLYPGHAGSHFPFLVNVCCVSRSLFQKTSLQECTAHLTSTSRRHHRNPPMQLVEWGSGFQQEKPVKCTGLKGFLMENPWEIWLRINSHKWLWYYIKREICKLSDFKLGGLNLYKRYIYLLVLDIHVTNMWIQKPKIANMSWHHIANISNKSSLNDTDAVWFPPKHVQHWL